ncbi:splicing factor u2af-associated protein 2 [Moniliophthora roreri MCA 2997]|uniref:Splicing factor u2af-associated protein 2 n=1 Tax=Moniliophthora roreri (strain MCA 2997) TaxID=1381753 RepID=V2WUG2_MONRO|nr:splicing factor u2af-associated protein 2 [Moniliophthora roreri MCA 2997]
MSSSEPQSSASTAELPAALASDPRVYFSKESGTWRYEEDDDTEMEYDTAKAKWVPLVDEELWKKQQAAYAVAGVDEETPAAPVLARENKKRKDTDYTSAEAGPSTKRSKPERERKSKNTAVYVINLPPDTTHEELITTFSKYGVLEEDDDGEPKVKMYANDDGRFGGEALVVYFKEESVDLAVTLLDESELRLGDKSSIMRVAKADFTHKHKGSGGDGPTGGERKVVDRKKATRRIGKMQKKLQEWNDEDGFGPSIDDESEPQQRPSRVVVLKHMFSLKELEEDPTLLLDLKEDVREEAETLGEVTNVVLYDKEPEGIMTIKFRDPISAQACIIKMNGRFFAGRRIEASLYTGRARFKRSDDQAAEDGEEEEKKRLNDFAKWLEGDE